MDIWIIVEYLIRIFIDVFFILSSWKLHTLQPCVGRLQDYSGLGRCTHCVDFCLIFYWCLWLRWCSCNAYYYRSEFIKSFCFDFYWLLKIWMYVVTIMVVGFQFMLNSLYFFSLLAGYTILGVSSRSRQHVYSRSNVSARVTPSSWVAIRTHWACCGASCSHNLTRLLLRSSLLLPGYVRHLEKTRFFYLYVIFVYGKYWCY